MRKVINMTNEEAKEFFMKSSSYFSLSLPEYFNFTVLLKQIESKMNGTNLNDVCKKKPKDLDEVNYELYQNKDGKFVWRKLQLINPVIYVDLANYITEAKNWKFIVNRFKEFKKNKKIICCSDIVESTSQTKDQGASIEIWLNDVEQKSIELALKYNWLGITDISNCYDSIYTHSIAWALHDISVAKEQRSASLIGNIIDEKIQNMSYGQTNGIPQGSRLMDFIAEIVLGYGDVLVSEALKNAKIKDYTILRYRDDYRVFAKNEVTLNTILKVISETLSILNFRMNSQKTMLSDDIISKSIKEDKIEAFNLNYNTNLKNSKKLLTIRELAKKYPNSGTLKTLLFNFYKKDVEKLSKRKKDNIVIISIVVNLMYNNPNLYPICVTILSKLLSFENMKNRELIIKSIEDKFASIPNTDYLNIWLQRITLTYNPERKFVSKICEIINDSTAKLWNSSWLRIEVNDELIVDRDKIKKLTPVISSSEAAIFEDYIC